MILSYWVLFLLTLVPQGFLWDLLVLDLSYRNSGSDSLLLESICQVLGGISNPRPIEFLIWCIWDHTSSVNSSHKSMGLWACGYRVSEGNCIFTPPDLHVLPSNGRGRVIIYWEHI